MALKFPVSLQSFNFRTQCSIWLIQ